MGMARLPRDGAPAQPDITRATGGSGAGFGKWSSVGININLDASNLTTTWADDDGVAVYTITPDMLKAVSNLRIDTSVVGDGEAVEPDDWKKHDFVAITRP